MDNPNCSICRYAKETQIADAQGQPIIGQYQYNCIRFPPSAFALPGPQGVSLGSAFPVVSKEQLCSLFEPKDATEQIKPPDLKLA